LAIPEIQPKKDLKFVVMSGILSKSAGAIEVRYLKL
jgi:hypothetical protein